MIKAIPPFLFLVIDGNYHVSATRAAGTGEVGGCSGWVVCGGTLQALSEAAQQVGWVLTPVGL